MRFTRRHEQELTEIKGLAHDLDHRVTSALEQLERIKRGGLGGDEPPEAAPDNPQTPHLAELAPPVPEPSPADQAGEPAKQPGRIRDSLRRYLFGPDIELDPSDAERAGPPEPPPIGDGDLVRTPGEGENGAGSLIAFVHIPKTAGGTVTSMFAAAYSKQAIDKAGNFVRGPDKTHRKLTRREGGWENWHQKGGRVSVGHTPYGVFRAHLPADVRYMTFLREPIDRVLSHYYRHIHRPPHRQGRVKHKQLGPGQGRRIKADSLEQAMVEMNLPQLNNLSTRFLCGHESPMGDLPPSAVDDAKESLRGFAFIGIQERFEESLVLLRRLLGLGSIPYVDRHVSTDGGRPAVDEIPDEQRALIAERNALDAELYRFGLELFDAQVAGAGEGFAADVEALRSRNAAARKEEWLKAVPDASPKAVH